MKGADVPDRAEMFSLVQMEGFRALSPGAWGSGSSPCGGAASGLKKIHFDIIMTMIADTSQPAQSELVIATGLYYYKNYISVIITHKG